MKCKYHGPSHPSVWACPQCFVELREQRDELLVALQFVMTATGEQLTTAFEQAQEAILKATSNDDR